MRKLCLLVTLLLVMPAASNAEEIIHYKGRPVTVNLVKDEERAIEFEDHIQVGLSIGQREANQFRLQSAQGVLLIKPNTTFPAQRIQIKRVSDGQIILLDIVSSERSESSIENLEPVRIVLESDNTVDGQTLTEAEAGSDAPLPVITPVELVRYASQRLYGPNRLHKAARGITNAQLGVEGTVRLFKGPNSYKTNVTPISAYKGGAYYLSALYIKNTSSDVIQLNYLDINLPFTSATLQHHTLQPSGIPGDATTLYLVSEEPLKSTLYPWTYFSADAVPAKETEVAK